MEGWSECPGTNTVVAATMAHRSVLLVFDPDRESAFLFHIKDRSVCLLGGEDGDDQNHKGGRDGGGVRGGGLKTEDEVVVTGKLVGWPASRRAVKTKRRVQRPRQPMAYQQRPRQSARKHPYQILMKSSWPH
mgnify:CR=1 FL=1